MAGTTTTLTGAGSTVQPRALHEGVQCVTQDYKLNGNTLSASDILLMLKVPRHAKIMDWYLFGNAGATTTTFKIGLLGGTGTELATAATLSATDAIRKAGTVASDILPVTITASDSNVNAYKVIQLLATSVPSATVTGSFTLAVFYAMDGSN